MKKVIYYLFLVLLFLAILFFAGYLFIFQWIVNWLWLSGNGFSVVLTSILRIKIAAFACPFLASLIILYCWFYIFRRIKKNAVFNILIACFSIICGVYGYLNWKSLLFYPFIKTAFYADPLFHLDAYFYISILPILRSVIFIVSGILSFVLFFDLIIYHGGEKGIYRDSSLRFNFTTMLLFMITSLFWILYFLLNILEITVSQPGKKLGIGFSEYYGLILGAGIWCLLFVCVVLFFILKTIKGLKPFEIFICAVILAVLYFGMTGLYPLIMENYFVKPNELMLERPFIKCRIDSTRAAFGLNFTPLYYPVYENKINGFETAVKSLRIWDADPYKKVIDQVQTIKTYFDFADVDVDAYYLSNRNSGLNIIQVLIAARELNISNLPPEALNWDNIHLRYTHGHGVVVSPSHLIDNGGSPVFWAGGIDRQPSYPELALNFPQVYFGELTSHYIIVNTKADEFEYTTETNRINYRYLLKRGVNIGDFLSRILFSIVFREKNIFLSGYLTPGSRIVFHRNILDRVKTAFPFLAYDADPYPAIIDGRLIWIIDAYTVSDRFPLAEKFDSPFGKINYIRNSVKVAVDAYSGDITFYITDKDDPVIQSYNTIFPGIFKISIPPSIEAHFRYPQSLFKVQTDVLRRYHTDNEDSFYNGDNVWDIPRHIYGDKAVDFEPYYMLSEFATNSPAAGSNYIKRFTIIEPFTPRGRENISGWVLGYFMNGLKISLYYPDEYAASYGPMQVETKINQDDRMSSFFTLWGQKGSKVFRGNIKFIPVNNGIFYVEPVFLESEQMSMPELVKIVGIYDGAVYIGSDYSDLLKNMASIDHVK